MLKLKLSIFGAGCPSHSEKLETESQAAGPEVAAAAEGGEVVAAVGREAEPLGGPDRDPRLRVERDTGEPSRCSGD